MGQKELKIRLAGQMSIFNAEAQAIIDAIKIIRRWGVDKRIIMTDFLEPKANVGACACGHQGK
jgi:hypothetical protein